MCGKSIKTTYVFLVPDLRLHELSILALILGYTVLGCIHDSLRRDNVSAKDAYYANRRPIAGGNGRACARDLLKRRQSRMTRKNWKQRKR